MYIYSRENKFTVEQIRGKETRPSHSMRMKKDLDGSRRLDRTRPTYIGEGGRPQVAWRLRRAVTPWRIDRIRHARWRHDHGPSQTGSTWTARPRSRGRGLIRVHWLVNRWRAPYRDWPRPRLPHDHAHIQWARVGASQVSVDLRELHCASRRLVVAYGLVLLLPKSSACIYTLCYFFPFFF